MRETYLCTSVGSGRWERTMACAPGLSNTILMGWGEKGGGGE